MSLNCLLFRWHLVMVGIIVNWDWTIMRTQINDGATINLMVVGSYYICVIVIPILLVCLLYAKSSRFRNTVIRIFGFCCRKPLKLLRGIGKTSKLKKNNNNSSEKYDYVKYSNMNAWHLITNNPKISYFSMLKLCNYITVNTFKLYYLYW